jgi:hypothetical protein
MEHFKKLNAINVNDKTEKKNGLTFLSWALAWTEVKKVYPNADYNIKKFENGLPYVYDEKTGYMVFTDVTIECTTYEMWLPVMDGANKAMKSEPYEYTTKYGTKTVEAATMFDINKTIMRCLVKNLGMFGLGLYIYAGEDLPENEQEPKETKKEKATMPQNVASLEQRNELKAKIGVEKFASIMNENKGKLPVSLFNELMEG